MQPFLSQVDFRALLVDYKEQPARNFGYKNQEYADMLMFTVRMIKWDEEQQ